jgi:hypothetical protein
MPFAMKKDGPAEEKDEPKAEAKKEDGMVSKARAKASKEIISALEAKDHVALDAALSRHYRACEGDE